MWLVLSSAYVGQELAAEFGLLPPTFLPVGTKRLYEYQLAEIGTENPVYLTLPHSFALPPEDARRLRELQVTVLPIPDGLSLGEAVIYASNLIGAGDGPLRILHGDTLVGDLPAGGQDEIGLSGEADSYSWAEAEIRGEQLVRLETVLPAPELGARRPVACGYFSFSSNLALVRAITRARGSFIEGINLYAGEQALQARWLPSWFDFGHVQRYFRSRLIVSTTRAFNTLTIDGKTVRKTSQDGAKIKAEAAWFRAAPPDLQVYCARILQSGEADGRHFYDTEYEYMPTLSELFVFGLLGKRSWQHVLDSYREMLGIFARHQRSEPGDTALRELTITKTRERLQLYAEQTGFPVDAPTSFAGRPLPSLLRIAEQLEDRIDFESGRPQTIMHGDVGFSNVMFNSRARRIRVIDPRGFVQAGEPTLYGDLRYDFGKLAHSVVGRYDQILAGRYELASDGRTGFTIAFETAPHHGWLEDALGDLTVDGVQALSPEIAAINVSLFLSMLPLHFDRPDRQRAFVANALRLFSRLEQSAARGMAAPVRPA